MKTLLKFVFSALSFYVSAWALQKWLIHDWTLVWFVMAAILLHEAGHFFALLVYGLKPSMFFVPFLGAAVTASGIDQLNHRQMAILALAGPIVNFILAIGGIAWFAYGDPLGLKFASINMSLCWFNLIPFFILDGARFIKSIYASLDQEADKVVAGIVSALTILVGFGLIVAGRANFMYLLIYYGIKTEADKDNPSDAYSSKAMTESEAMTLVKVYTFVLLVSMTISSFLPPLLDK